MQTFAEIEKQALKLSEVERARLATTLLGSLPATLVDADDGLAEARRRSAEMDSDPSSIITLEELKRGVGR